MTASVANYDAYLRSEWSWMLGRFIVPVARLGEFEEFLGGLATPLDEGVTKWRLSALVGADPAADVTQLREFTERMMRGSGCRSAVAESVEVKIARVEEITRFAGIIPRELATYFEIPLQMSNCREFIREVAACGRRAKVRTGGETADKFPASESVIEFIRECSAAHVPFKATAGLHHLLRSVQRLTYQPESAMMHGFLNVFLAAAFLRAGMEADVAVQLLDEQSAQAFHFDFDGAAWREHRLSQDEIASTAEFRDFIWIVLVYGAYRRLTVFVLYTSYENSCYKHER